MNTRNRKIIGLLATTAALAAGPGAASAAASWSVSDATTTEGGNLAFTVTANCENGIFPCIDERFSYSVQSGSAEVGSDLPSATGGVLLSAAPLFGTTRVIEVPTTDDSIDEPENQTVRFTISHSGKFGSASREATGTIRDNDDEPQVSSVTAPATVNEGTGGSRTVPFTVKLSAPSEQTLTRSYSTEDGTAKAGQDYTATQGNLTFSPGETQKQVDVPLTTDSVDESDETFSLFSGGASALVKILDDDVTPDPGNQNPGGQNPGGQNPGGQVTTNTGNQGASTAGPQVIYVPSSTATAPAATKKATPKKKAAKKCRKGTVAKKGKNKKIRCVKKAKKRGSKSRK